MSLMKAVFASMMLVLTSACVLHEGRWLFLSDRSVALEDLGPFAMYCSSNFEKSPCSAALPVIQMPNGVHRIHIPKSEVQLQELASAWGIVGEGDAELISGHLEKGIAYDVLGAKVGKERLIELRLHLTSSPRQLARSYIFGWRWDGILMGCDPAGSDKCSTKGKSVRDLSFDKTLTNGVFFGTRSELAISGTRFGDFFQQEIAETAKRIAEKAQAEAAKAAEAAREKVEKAAEAAEELLNPKLRFSNGDTFEAGDTLFRKHSENKYETVTLVEIRKDRVKVRLPDGSNAWLAKSEFMTRDMVDAAKYFPANG